MKLFEDLPDLTKNYLPYDGTVNYYGPVFRQEISDLYFKTLLENLAWKNDEAVIFGKHLYTKRKVAWYGDVPFEYSYSGILKRALLWDKTLLEIKAVVEKETGERYNSCLCNLYHDGSEGMAWHSDAEKDLKKHGAIASLTLGAERKFGFKHKQSKETVYFNLAHGSLLVMKDQTQDYWLHRLPPTTKPHGPRINLTFRQIENY
ncbi:alpha-ketoglutarate-dependent dioxygenase AlkB family protein [Sphingobacterium psychroaquaticum]|uniref:Alkylated DNA repair dioxygenase AlkB n=1 Tax=Sphingobacterium psychroaquaticum TaxID=561061 RepID=A0A1X7KNH6_9SPHI|nr:alpha-ketoglutarate-dependent dioxygenase AlkB [Sphingobacterium psychroaquaticum]SMG43059.1 Alkylated DNA repair dioxygenase AlkB [Sphingobacterium psychroaquaticum]